MKKLDQIKTEIFQNPQQPSIDLAALFLLDQVDPDPENPSLVRDVIALYLRESGGSFGKLKALHAADDLKALANAAHSLKSSSASVGALKLSQLCQEMESIAKKGQTDQVLPVIQKISIEWLIVQADLNVILNS